MSDVGSLLTGRSRSLIAAPLLHSRAAPDSRAGLAELNSLGRSRCCARSLSYFCVRNISDIFGSI